MYRWVQFVDDAVVEAQSCVNTDGEISVDEQYTTRRFNLKVFVYSHLVSS